MPSIHAGDLDVYYIENGTQGGLGSIIFVHGNWATSSSWGPVLRAPPGQLLAEHRLRCLAAAGPPAPIPTTASRRSPPIWGPSSRR